MKAVLFFAAALAVSSVVTKTVSQLTLDEKLQEIEAKIRTNEAKMKALQGIRVYAEKNNIKKL